MKKVILFIVVAIHCAIIFSYLYDRSDVATGVDRRRLAALNQFQGILSDSHLASLNVLSSNYYVAAPRDGSVRFVKQWAPSDDNIRGLVIVSHGYGDNCDGVVARVASTLAGSSRGRYLVQCVDHAGHGRSDGLFGLVPNFDDMVDDFVSFVVRSAGALKDDNLPVFVYGDSMGGAVALLAGLDERLNDVVDAFVLAKPMVGIDERRKPPAALVSVMHKIAPWLPWLPGFAHGDMAGACFRREQDKQLAGRSLLGFGRHHKFGRLGTGASLFDAVERIEREERSFDRPFLLVQGRLDTLTCPVSAERFYRNAASSDKHIEWLEHGLHAPEYDDDAHSALFFNPILDFLGKFSSK